MKPGAVVHRFGRRYEFVRATPARRWRGWCADCIEPFEFELPANRQPYAVTCPTCKEAAIPAKIKAKAAIKKRWLERAEARGYDRGIKVNLILKDASDGN